MCGYKHSCSIISVLTYIASNGFKIYFDLFEFNLALAFIFMLNYLNTNYMHHEMDSKSVLNYLRLIKHLY